MNCRFNRPLRLSIYGAEGTGISSARPTSNWPHCTLVKVQCPQLRATPIRYRGRNNCKSDCYLQDKTDAENMALLERVTSAAKIYMIGSEFHGDLKSEPVATTAPEQIPPQCGVEWTRLALEHSRSTGHAQELALLPALRRVPRERVRRRRRLRVPRHCVRARVRAAAAAVSPPSTSSPDAAAPVLSATFAGLLSAESLCERAA